MYHPPKLIEYLACYNTNFYFEANMESLTFAPLNRPYNLGNTPEDATQKLHKDLKIIAQSRWVRVSDDGDFEQIGLIKWVVENIRGILGFVDHTKLEVLRFRLQQLLSQAAEKGLLTKEDCFGPKNLVFLVGKKMGLIQRKVATRDAKELNEFFKNLLQKVANPSENKPNLNRFVERYRARHLQDLQPHSLPWKIVNAWQKQARPLNEDYEEESTQSEFGSQEQETDGGASEFSDKPMYQQPESQEFVAPAKTLTAQPLQIIPTTPSQVGPQLTAKTPRVQQNEKKSYCTDFLERISHVDDLRDELEKLTPSPEVSYKELYLRNMLANPLQRTDYDNLVNEWVSDTLSMTNDWSSHWTQNAVNLDRTLSALDFKNSLSLLVAGFRLALLVKNEEEKQFEPSDQLISQCILAKEAFGSRLKTLIDSNQREFLSLNLSNFSPKELRFYKDTLSYQFLKILSDQQKLRLENEKISNWYKLTGIGLVGAGALLSGAAYALVKHLTHVPEVIATPVQTYPTISDAILSIGYVVPIAVIAGIAYHCLSKPRSKPTILPENLAPFDFARVFQSKANKQTKLPDSAAITYPTEIISPKFEITANGICIFEDPRINENLNQEFTNVAFIYKEGKQYLLISFKDQGKSVGFCVCLDSFVTSCTQPVKNVLFSEGRLEIQLNAPALLTKTMTNEDLIKAAKQFITKEVDYCDREFGKLLGSKDNKHLRSYLNSLNALNRRLDPDVDQDDRSKIESCFQEALFIDVFLKKAIYNVLARDYSQAIKTKNLPAISSKNQKDAKRYVQGIKEQFGQIHNGSNLKDLKKFETNLEDFKRNYNDLAAKKKVEKEKESEADPSTKYYEDLKGTYEDLIREAPEVPAENEEAAEELKAEIGRKFQKISDKSELAELKKFERSLDEFQKAYTALITPGAVDLGSKVDDASKKEKTTTPKPEVNEVKKRLVRLYDKYSTKIPKFVEERRKQLDQMTKSSQTESLFENANEELKALEALRLKLTGVDDKRPDAEMTYENIGIQIQLKIAAIDRIIESIINSSSDSKEDSTADEAKGEAADNESRPDTAEHKGLEQEEAVGSDTNEEDEIDICSKALSTQIEDILQKIHEEIAAISDRVAGSSEGRKHLENISRLLENLEAYKLQLANKETLSIEEIEIIQGNINSNSEQILQLLNSLRDLQRIELENSKIEETERKLEDFEEKEVDRSAIALRYENLSQRVREFTEDKREVGDPTDQAVILQTREKVRDQFNKLAKESVDDLQLENLEKFLNRSSSKIERLIQKHSSDPTSLKKSPLTEADPVQGESNSETKESESTESTEKEKEVDHTAIVRRYEELRQRVTEFTEDKREVSNIKIQMEITSLRRSIYDRFNEMGTDNLKENQLEEFELVLSQTIARYQTLILKSSAAAKHQSSPVALSSSQSSLERVTETDNVEEGDLANDEHQGRIRIIGDTYDNYSELPAIVKGYPDLVNRANLLLENSKQIDEYLKKDCVNEEDTDSCELLIPILSEEYEKIIKEYAQRKQGESEGSELPISSNVRGDENTENKFRALTPQSVTPRGSPPNERSDNPYPNPWLGNQSAFTALEGSFEHLNENARVEGGLPLGGESTDEAKKEEEESDYDSDTEDNTESTENKRSSVEIRKIIPENTESTSTTSATATSGLFDYSDLPTLEYGDAHKEDTVNGGQGVVDVEGVGSEYESSSSESD